MVVRNTVIYLCIILICTIYIQARSLCRNNEYVTGIYFYYTGILYLFNVSTLLYFYMRVCYFRILAVKTSASHYWERIFLLWLRQQRWVRSISLAVRSRVINNHTYSHTCINTYIHSFIHSLMSTYTYYM